MISRGSPSVRDLVALLRLGPRDLRSALGARLAGNFAQPSFELFAELARRAASSGASDEELGLSIGVLLATERERAERHEIEP